jgi:hypothetical protein
LADDGCLLPSDEEVEQKNVSQNEAGDERSDFPP